MLNTLRIAATTLVLVTFIFEIAGASDLGPQSSQPAVKIYPKVEATFVRQIRAAISAIPDPILCKLRAEGIEIHIARDASQIKFSDLQQTFDCTLPGFFSKQLKRIVVFQHVGPHCKTRNNMPYLTLRYQVGRAFDFVHEDLSSQPDFMESYRCDLLRLRGNRKDRPVWDHSWLTPEQAGPAEVFAHLFSYVLLDYSIANPQDADRVFSQSFPCATRHVNQLVYRYLHGKGQIAYLQRLPHLQTRYGTASLRVEVPDNCIVYINDHRTSSTGRDRSYVIRRLCPQCGCGREVCIKVVQERFHQGKLRFKTRKRTLTMHAGQEYFVRFPRAWFKTKKKPDDRGALLSAPTTGKTQDVEDGPPEDPPGEVSTDEVVPGSTESRQLDFLWNDGKNSPLIRSELALRSVNITSLAFATDKIKLTPSHLDKFPMQLLDKEVEFAGKLRWVVRKDDDEEGPEIVRQSKWRDVKLQLPEFDTAQRAWMLQLANPPEPQTDLGTSIKDVLLDGGLLTASHLYDGNIRVDLNGQQLVIELSGMLLIGGADCPIRKPLQIIVAFDDSAAERAAILKKVNSANVALGQALRHLQDSREATTTCVHTEQEACKPILDIQAEIEKAATKLAGAEESEKKAKEAFSQAKKTFFETELGKTFQAARKAAFESNEGKEFSKKQTELSQAQSELEAAESEKKQLEAELELARQKFNKAKSAVQKAKRRETDAAKAVEKAKRKADQLAQQLKAAL